MKKIKKKQKKGKNRAFYYLTIGYGGGVKKRDEKSFKIAKGAKKSVEIDIMS